MALDKQNCLVFDTDIIYLFRILLIIRRNLPLYNIIVSVFEE